MTKSRNIFIGAVAAVALVLPTLALADGHSEIVNAGMHAGFAAGSPDIGGVHAHLHHTLNCLVGPSGAGFDAKEMNPCANAGNGAIPDTADAAKKATLESAAAKAREGIASSDLAAAQKEASDARALLKKAE
jgi:hypothetical protein